MAKKRKTKVQKKLADHRHHFNHNMVSQITVDGKISLKEKRIKTDNIEVKTPKTTALNQYPYLIKDLSKTAILTSTILAFQIILFILITNHKLTVPGLSY